MIPDYVDDLIARWQIPTGDPATPCDVCGVLIPTPIYTEELGMCVDCSNAYFDHEGED